MTFFSRPSLENSQFRQNINSLLTLSGQTQIAKVSGLTLTDGLGGYIPIVVTGGTNFDVLTYDGTVIRLLPSSGSSSGIYSGASPTTITVGGLASGSAIFGNSISNILESMLVPTLYPTLTPPSNVFTIDPPDVLYEVGASISVTGTSVFDYGSISPAYPATGDTYRSGLVNSYDYNVWGSTCNIPSIIPVDITSFGTHPVTYGNNTLSVSVCYDAGLQPLDSKGNNYNTPLPSGCTATAAITISGIYPYFYGTASSSGASAGVNRPAATPALISGGTKVVEIGNGTLCINFNSTSDDYIWLSIPSASIAKTKWFVDYLNNGNIGGSISVGGNLFPAPVLTTGVTTTYWSGQTYSTYISNYQLPQQTIMEFRNT